MMKNITIIIPVYNEELSINSLYSELKSVADNHFNEYEVIYSVEFNISPPSEIGKAENITLYRDYSFDENQVMGNTDREDSIKKEMISTAATLIINKLIKLSCNSQKIVSINKLLESLSYKSIVNRGYSVIKNSKEKILKSKKDILSDKKLIIETKFGILQSDLSTEKNE